ncbi:MAG: hypothetical protein KDJ17_09000 [Hyphomicrobiaceae bacterium]|nr:hypothetical protein [Hyphomicrobiaceae bacterium]
MALVRDLLKFAGVAVVGFAGMISAQSVQAAESKLFCRFETGYVWTYEGGKFSSSPSAPLAFEIDDVDLDAQSAKLIIEGKDAGQLRIVRALNANHFLEVANEGFLNLTTIYDADPANPDVQPAVHSRHFGLLGQPMFSQYAGTCTHK